MSKTGEDAVVGDVHYACSLATQSVCQHSPLPKIQQKVYDEARFMPIWELTALHASGPRVAVSGLGLIPLFAYSGPYEDPQLKS